ncbi:FtsX-like permease family protein [Cryobacterium serini]|uniref:FtsX-like permease family protein n=1 Tax=Cryobacterium serini TaxID=1259201 RepID=A0A4R9BSK4_9MICO|nr:FtsX-like permease family protein [Cryobacterium serini]TFD90111.1 FtsX-like permease family protein [Cryobacterium serini]
MNPSIVRLAVIGSRASGGRLLGITAGVAVGVTLALLLGGAYQGLDARDERSSWMSASGGYVVDGDTSPRAVTGDMASLGTDRVLLARTTDRHAGARIVRFDVAALTTSSVTIPGITDLPQSGGYYASPALIDRIARVPADELGDRFGTLTGTISDAGLASPDSLVVVVGATANDLLERPTAQIVTDFTGLPYRANSNYQTVAIVGAIAVLFPVLLLVSIVTGLGAAARRERFATLRLIGATPRTVAAIAALETAATSLVGALIGVLMAALLGPVAALVPVDDGVFFAADLAVTPLTAALVVAVTVAASAATAGWRIRRAGIGPLGQTKQRQEKTPSMLRLLPLAGGLGMLIATTLAVLAGLPVPRVGTLIIIGFTITTVGLLVAGPYLTLIAGRIMARRSGKAAGIIAGNRIRRTPVATFRSVSGLVIAVFMVSVFAGAATTADRSAAPIVGPGSLAVTTLIQYLEPTLDAADPAETDAERARLAATPGVTGVVTVYTLDSGDGPDVGRLLLVAEAAKGLGLGAVPPAAVVSVNSDVITGAPAVFTPAEATDVAELTPSILLLGTDGSTAALERARTALQASTIFKTGWVPAVTRTDLADDRLQSMAASYATLAYLGIGVATLIAGLSLAIATVSAMIDRRRILALLRLLGMNLAGLRRIITLEAAAPLLAVMALSIGLGFLVADLILVGLTDGGRSVGWPDARYLGALTASVVLALAAVAAAAGRLGKNTDLAAIRYE